MALVAPFKKSKTVPANCRFKSFQSFYNWQSNAKRFFDHVSGRQVRSAGLRNKVDGGAKLLQALAHADDGKPLFSAQEQVALVVLIGCCREDGMDLRNATRGWVSDLIGKSTEPPRVYRRVEHSKDEPYDEKTIHPRLSTIVFGAKGAANFDLIRQEETLEAGRTYRSPEPASLAIPAGQESVSVYLRKEASPWPRKANVSLGAPLKQQAAVSLWVEQKPAAGRARNLMEAPDIERNFTVDHMRKFVRRTNALTAFVATLGGSGRQLDRRLFLQSVLWADNPAHQRDLPPKFRTIQKEGLFS